MTRTYRFEVPGVPVAKQRPRMARVKSGVRTYTPKKSAAYENRVGLFANMAGVPTLRGKVKLKIAAVWPMKGRPLKRGIRPSFYKQTRPDLDNVLKAVMDGLNGVVYLDDGQVCEAVVAKFHAAQGAPPRTEVYVYDLEDE